ncbi:hypothetical protein IMX26_15300 [Clostridium sp. 'deep sea']|uniref:S41 family peptidase n=1 Tax=Clostridium sp. 'deep sea' TaxID=2779445 RepID=UPI00189646F9|nr:S41 family peptidase [Clostridium sp. 'deep sea']QOR34807.1 hypothetical protein IMX26_15300 [Clostridium sp. 'deep sea']
MIKKIKLLVPTAILIFLLILSTTVQPIGNYSSQQKQEDFLFVYNLLAKEYPFFSMLERKYNIKWLANKDTYLERIKATKNDTQFYTELKNILCELYDGHTHIVSPKFYHYLKELANDLELDSDKYNNEFLVKPLNSAQRHYEFWTKKFGYTPKSFEQESNNVNKKNYIFQKYHNGETIYLKIKSFKMSHKECQQVYDYIINNKDCSSIIIDIRDNKGGNSGQWLYNIVFPLNTKSQKHNMYYALRGGKLSEKFAKIFGTKYKVEMSQRPILPNYPPELTTNFKFILNREEKISPKDPIDFIGKIYVLINNKVYSSAESLALFCKNTGFATLVGERTKGDGGGFSPILVKLPNSGLLLRMRLQMVLNRDGSANAEYGTAPDIEVKAAEALTETLKIIEQKTNK